MISISYIFIIDKENKKNNEILFKIYKKVDIFIFIYFNLMKKRIMRFYINSLHLNVTGYLILYIFFFDARIHNRDRNSNLF